MNESVAVFPLDIHKRFSVATPMDEGGEVLDKIRLEHADRAQMQTVLAELPEGTDVVMEATFNWPWIADFVQDAGLVVHLAAPRQTARLRQGKPKSDGRDAMFLGKLWLGGLLPEVYLAPPPVRHMRAVSRWRMLLVRMRTSVKNNIHGQLHRLGMDLSAESSDIFSPKGRELLARLPLAEHERELLEQKLRVVEIFTALIEPVQQQMRQELAEDPRARILISMPGIGPLLAYTILAEIGEIERFPTPRALAAYAGVLPLANESGDKDFGKRTGREANHALRWAALEAVTGGVRASPRLASLHARVRNRNKKTPNKARVAVARKLMELLHVLLSRGETYREHAPRRPQSRARSRPCPPRDTRRGGARYQRSRRQLEHTRVAGTGRDPMNRASQTALSAPSAAGR